MSSEIEIPPIARRPPLVSRPALLSVHALPKRRIRGNRPRWELTLVLLTLTSVWIALGGWAAWGRVDTFTSGMGRVVPAQTVQAVQTLEGGILSELPVVEGAIVEEGQIVARISDVAAVSEYQQLRAKYLSSRAAVVRLEAEIVRQAPLMSDELDGLEGRPYAARELQLFKARMEELQASVSVIQRQRDQRREELYGIEERIRGLRDMLVPLRQEYALTADLTEKGFKPRIELIRMQQRVSDTESQLRSANGQLPAVRAGIREAEQRIEERQRTFDSQARAELSQRHGDLAATVEALRNLRDRVERRDLRAPVRGEVKQIRLKTIGGVLQPGQTLMEIVPLGDLLMVEVPITPSDIAFVTQGMPARIKITAYDHTVHGWIGGTVELISPDAIVNEKGDAFFQVRVKPDRGHLGTAERPLPVLPGMMATVDVVTGSRTILEYLLKPVMKAKDRAMTER